MTMRRIGHCATMAIGLLALKGLRPNLSGLIGEHVAFFAANPERPLREMPFAGDNLKTPGHDVDTIDVCPVSFPITRFQVFPMRQILADAIGLPCPYCGHPMQHPKARQAPAKPRPYQAALKRRNICRSSKPSRCL
jgi:hypothetical protein